MNFEIDPTEHTSCSFYNYTIIEGEETIKDLSHNEKNFTFYMNPPF